MLFCNWRLKICFSNVNAFLLLYILSRHLVSILSIPVETKFSKSVCLWICSLKSCSKWIFYPLFIYIRLNYTSVWWYTCALKSEWYSIASISHLVSYRETGMFWWHWCFDCLKTTYVQIVFTRTFLITNCFGKPIYLLGVMLDIQFFVRSESSNITKKGISKAKRIPMYNIINCTSCGGGHGYLMQIVDANRGLHTHCSLVGIIGVSSTTT